MDDQLLDDIIQWDVKNWSRLIKIWQPILDKNSEGKALALGEREGGLSLWLALNNKEVICTDYKEFKRTPLLLHSKYKIEDRINYSTQDATKLSFEDNSFDIVIFKSMLGALNSLAKQEKVLKEAYRVLKPSGHLIFAENLKATRLHQYARKKFTSWGKNWRYPSIIELEKNCQHFSSFNHETHGFLSNFGRNKSQQNILSAIDGIFKTITPKNWKYILFGIAQK